MTTKGYYLCRGDITMLKIDVIVNAANRALLGSVAPCHGCIYQKGQRGISLMGGLLLDCILLLKIKIKKVQ